MIKKLNKDYDHLRLYYGLGFTQQKRILNLFGLKKSSISYNDLLKLEHFIRKNFLLEYKLKTEIHNNVKNLIKVKNYKGFRHRYNLPVNGQKTKVNRITRRNYKLPEIGKKYIDDTFKLIKKYNES